MRQCNRLIVVDMVIFRRFVNLIVALFLVASLTFFLMQAIPGDPFTQEHAIPTEILEAMRHHYGLDQPIMTQYFIYMKKLITFNLGPSFKYEGQTVNQIILEGYPISFALGLSALFISLFLGLILGTLSALYHRKWQDHLFIFIAILGISTPSFILATLFQYLFALKLNWFPIARWGTLSHLVLPALSLAALPTAFISRLVRSSMIEVLSQDYIMMAKAKGLSMLQIIRSHVLKNALLPAISYIGHVSATILTGNFVIEKIFGIPGLGNWFVSSIANRDYTMIMGITMFFSATLMGITFITDVIYCFVDPRIKKSMRLTHG